ncbi:hypothetical protein CHUV2995_00524 [Corynebacterium diphtheriae subsp. lausannense]|nr:hypothetical protein CHUV2995_00524 [Corynebacterium diphtheriae subsp. lausannense]
MAQDIGVLGFAGKRVSKPSTHNHEPTVQPNGNIIVDTIYRTAEPGVTIIEAEPINECPTCRSCLRARQFKDHGQGDPLDTATPWP